MNSPRTGKILGLDGLRTIALFGVLFFHMFPNAVSGGYFGVILFFVISGFLSGYSSSLNREGKLLPYYARRAKRIYPALVIMIFITVEMIAILDHFRLQNAWEEILSVLLGYNNYWQIYKRADYFANLASGSAFTHLWYISILMQFELVWPLLFRFVFSHGKEKTLFRIFLGSLAIMPMLSFLPSVSKSLLYYGTLSRIHALLGGAWLGMRRGRRKRMGRMKPAISLVLLLLFVLTTVWIFLQADGRKDWVYHFGMAGYALLSLIALTVLLMDQRRAGPLLELPVFAFFSRYSYEIYLWQMPVLFVFGLKGLNTSAWHFVLQGLVLLLLSVWTNTVVSRLFP
ncbi:MAG: acyltransferase [Solobacterium sp.]|nr:acyltransferase [Solobacterium sp.]